MDMVFNYNSGGSDVKRTNYSIYCIRTNISMAYKYSFRGQSVIGAFHLITEKSSKFYSQ